MSRYQMSCYSCSACISDFSDSLYIIFSIFYGNGKVVFSSSLRGEVPTLLVLNVTMVLLFLMSCGYEA
ncbi:hypothetical protein HanIR_Chr09g0444531 [Helianthus annuus]|nr:hypothetical protein HanIR_Chr09g0444531 [Helianthus annuus]